MENIIEPLSRDLLERELTPARMIRRTGKADNEIYVVTAAECPNVMLEIGRLRELAFRTAGGGTGQSVDIDDDDRATDGYRQLIVWDPAAREILGGYRFIVSTSGHPAHLSSEHYFGFSELFRTKYLPHTIELGRSFVIPRKGEGGTRNPKILYALDNLWDGLGALMIRNPESKYFFGKVTMYGDYNREARNLLLCFLQKYFPDRENLLTPINPVELDMNEAEVSALFDGGGYEEDLKILHSRVKALGETVPPLINSYMNVSPSMKVFGTVTNPDFGGVEETGLLITIGDLYPDKVGRHLDMDLANIELV
ncbi:MAG: GNAT family N-acetyltransferase [Alistipes sp.]|nr:GNAT family N-acetyltransferase [Alistipes sp.]